MENQMSPAVKQNDERESAEVVAVARRRKFTASYKRRFVSTMPSADADVAKRVHEAAINNPLNQFSLVLQPQGFGSGSLHTQSPDSKCMA
ncbi:hypothetical protein [Massilia psychrophila]|uniref:Uncharacterized protein n=1 Tax=Massilia psychrophila TaxID=1603353 RepID=A0A2G8SY05_9BURK|nr:hypothetical protein [Massilia psychrophila]PIL38593.1 hypothetical protein CR103_16900 [Massilia psychrophila]GGE69683.1 hypothetical protein GCM10008020_12760 [Massilia psychrophila]